MTFYVYELVDPRDQAVFYVGKGKGDRRFAHEREAVSGKAGPKCERIREIIAAGLATESRIVERFADEQAAYDAEAALIAKLGAENLTNIMLGGFGGRVKRDRLKDARKTVRNCAKHIRHAVTRYRQGDSAVYFGRDLLKVAYDLAMDLRARTGEEYFDKIVGEPEWRPA